VGVFVVHYLSNMAVSSPLSNNTQTLTFEEEAQKRYAAAANSTSLPGELCKFVGSIGVIIGGALVAASIATGNGNAALLSGGIAGVGALAGAPIAALGSIASSNKRNNRLNELNVWLKVHRY
jgi:hypothetical protein